MKKTQTKSLPRAKRKSRGSLKNTKVEQKLISDLQAQLKNTDVTGHVGSVSYAGRNKAGVFQVQFDESSTQGWISEWPDWAYQLALDALLHGKKLFIAFEGDRPTPSSMVSAYVFYYSV